MNEESGPTTDAEEMTAGSRFWDVWSDVIVAKPWPIIFLCLAVSGMFAAIAVVTPRDLSLNGMLGADEPEVIAFEEMDAVFGSNSLMMLVLEGEQEDVDTTLAALVEGFAEKHPEIKILPPPDPQWLIDRGPWLWPEGTFNSIMKAVEEGNEPEALVNQANVIDNFIRDVFNPIEGVAILNFEFTSGTFDIMGQVLGIQAVQKTVTEIMDELDTSVEANYTGGNFLGTENGEMIFRRLAIITPISLIAIMFLVLRIEPRISRTILAGIGLGCSVAIGLGTVGLIVGKISIMSSVFATILLGLGVDFAIHLLVSPRDAGAEGLSPEESVKQTIDRTGTPICLGGLSTGLAFAVLLFIPDQGAQDVGLTALAGMGSGLILMLTFLPAS